ncbi:DNA-binding transcriptional regulator, LysR family [Thermosyntropha lipolytica DSM 11003]|uniref:DNA-binding transcriptional regulator, LysR family n=1 Tax=Thermosyntropha lipolytica DSM 11003 TaxID=1123382 RepID=A0A1M5K2R1_9FIRM|nr:LysR family transcriptional regulator [Thermosyntropha lipolytica]SHG47046.1 DNA-binding transcriptional regulator, LysR family [Thermosyntropha lipolytica DSM 11003]
MNIEQLEIFMTIAKVKSFTRAAKILNFTQPAISSQIKQLEKHYNVRLFERGSNGVTLTEAGRKFYEYAEKIMHLYSEMESEIARVSGHKKELIKLGASFSPGNYFLPTAIKNFKGNYPQAYIRVNIGHSDEIVEGLQERVLDIGVVEGEIKEARDLERYKVSSNQLILVADIHSRWRNVDEIAIAELVNEPFITREEECSLRYFLNSYLKTLGYDMNDMNIIMELTNWEAIKQAVMKNLGLAVIPYPVVERELKERKLKRIRLKDGELRFTWDTEVLIRRDEKLTGLKKVFFDFLISPYMVWKTEEELVERNKMLFI